MVELSGKTAIITGASSGIGEGIAWKLAAHGVNLVLAARRLENLHALKQSIAKEYTVDILTIQTDVTNEENVRQLVRESMDHFGQIDLLVNNAGQMLDGRVRSSEVAQWDTMIDVNIKGALYGIDAVLPSMVQRGAGHIINVASVSGFEVTKISTVYSATKFALRAISMGLEKELAQTGVRVTNISPGMVDTPLSKAYTSRKKLEVEDIADAVVYAISQPEYVNVNEITIRPV